MTDHSGVPEMSAVGEPVLLRFLIRCVPGFGGLVSRFYVAWRELRDARIHRVEVLRMEQAVEFFTDSRSRAGPTATAAMLRQPKADGLVVHLMFVDPDGKPLLPGSGRAPSRVYSAKRLDEELAVMFDSQNIVILA